MGGFGANLASHWWIILLIVILIFGATKLPQLAKGIGQSVKILRKEIKDDSSAASEPAASTTPPAAATPPASTTTPVTPADAEPTAKPSADQK